MRIKVERILLILVLFGLFLGSFYVMNLSYDSFARYNYELSEEQKKELKSNLSNSDMELIITNQIPTDIVFRFLHVRGFEMKNILWYQKALDTRENDLENIVSFINTYRNKEKLVTVQDVQDYLTSYSYDTLIEFFDSENSYLATSTLIRKPDNPNLVLKGNYSVYNYEPKELVQLSGVPMKPLYTPTIQVSKVMETSVQNLCIELTKVSEIECGGLQATIGYLSFETQKDIFSDFMLKYGKDEISKHWDYPSQNEYQLGYSLKFDFVEEDLEKQKKEDTIKWLAEHSHEYGFIVRYPKGKENETGKGHQELTLRYVGLSIASEIHSKNLSLDEYR